MGWNQTLTNLRDVLADLYPTLQDARRVAEEAGLNPAYIAFETKAINNWHHILLEAQKQDLVHAIISVARREYPRNQWLLLAQQGNLQLVTGPDIRQDVTWKGPDDTSQLEKILGSQNTLLPISFLEVGLMKARSVARIVRPDDCTGSGFLTSGNLLVTNHHVLPTEAVAQEAIVQFNYEQTAQGLDTPREDRCLLPWDVFETSQKDDWTVVRVEGDANQRWGAIELEPIHVGIEDRVSIIQHAGGGPKQVALCRNLVVFVGNRRIQYLTDTLPGSSGAPVFSINWRVAAVHHSSGWLREPQSKQVCYRNEGIHVNAIIEGLIATGLYSA